MPRFRWNVEWMDGTEKTIDTVTPSPIPFSAIFTVQDLLGNTHNIPWANVREVECEQIQEAPGGAAQE